MNKNKYFCKKCKTPKSPFIELILSEDNGSAPIEKEVIRTFKVRANRPFDSQGKVVVDKIFDARKLECGHFISSFEPGFTDASSENLNEFETVIIRNDIDRNMRNKSKSEVEQQILFHCEQYKTLLKIASKQRQQAKYAIIYLDQLREKFSAQLSSEERESFEMKFAHFLDLRPTTNKTIEREQVRVDKAVDKQKAALDAVRALMASKGFKPKDLFGAKEGDSQ